jgi:hypothetical protein
VRTALCVSHGVVEEVLDAASIERAGAADDAVDLFS